MHSEALVWLTTGIGGPLSVVWLCWAILVLWFGRGQWRPSDPLLVALLAEAIAKQAAGTAGSALSLFRPDEPALCSAVQWLWTAAHTMQAGTLASLALMAALRRKKRAVTAGGRPLLLYHLASLSAVSACVGAASLIAQTDPCAPPSDRRYAVFSLVLHACLAAVCAASTAFGCAGRRHKGPDPLLVNSSSDLSSCPSDVSTVSTCSRAGIRHSVSDCSDRTAATVTTTASAAVHRGGLVHDLLRLPPSVGDAPPVTFLHGAPRALLSTPQRHQQRQHGPEDDCTLADTGTLMTCSDRDSYAASTIGPYRYGLPGSRYLPSTAASVSVTSTNSRAPCLSRRVLLVQDVRIGYVAAILFMCYFVDHLPVLVLMASEHFFPSRFVFSADYAPVVKNFPMLAALAEACLWPVVLLLFDDQFVPRLSNLYRRRSASDRAKPPQGLHGKFRPYNSSLQDARRPPQTSNGGGGEAVRFPITNGSLFASLDGRVPVLHNYRRGVRTMSGLLVPPPPHFIHASTDPAGLVCCEDDRPHYQHHHHHHHHHHQQQQQQQQQQHPHHHRSLRFANMVTASAAMSTTDGGDCKAAAAAVDDSSTPVDSLDNAVVVVDGGDRLPQNLQQLREKLYAQDDDDDDDDESCFGGGRSATRLAEPTAGDSSSDDDGDHREDCCEDEDEYATLSARSACSATTAANDDFEYFAGDDDGGGGSSETAADASLPGRVPYRRAPTRRVRPHRDHPHHGHSPRRRHHQHDVQYVQQQYHRLRRPTGASPAPPTPPAARRPKARLAPVLSVDSLVAAQLQQQRRDNDHACLHGGGGVPGRPQHHRGGIAGRRLGDGRGHHGGSVPDLKRVFVTDFL